MIYDYFEWLKNPYKIFCKCGCGGEIVVKSYHKYKGISEYIRGHNVKRIIVIGKSYQKWLDDGCPKLYCECSCNGEIIIKKYHKWEGIPKFIVGHSKPNLGKKFSEETKQKMSIIKIGSRHSKETKRKMSESKRGENHPNFGNHWSEETKIKLSESKRGENNPNWQGGITHLPYCEKWTEKKREEVREYYNRKCYICGRDEKDNITKTGKQWKLSVHHIDMDKEQGCNNKNWKLVPLCMHCHNSKKMEILNDKK